MPKKFWLTIKLLCLILGFFLSVRPALAVVDPTQVPNNRFGIHILESLDLGPAAPFF